MWYSIKISLARCICFPGYLKSYFPLHNDLSYPIKNRCNDTTLKLFKTYAKEKIVCNNQQHQQGVWKEKIQRFTLNSFFLEFALSPMYFRFGIVTEKMHYRIHKSLWSTKQEMFFFFEKLILSKTKISYLSVIKISSPFNGCCTYKETVISSGFDFWFKALVHLQVLSLSFWIVL